MTHPRLHLLIVASLVVLLGMVLVVLSGIGDASVTGSTGSVLAALEKAGHADEAGLRDDLFAVVLRLKDPWALVNYCGVGAIFLGAAAFLFAWRTRT